tara:strand:- start:10 stop:549 length:540 start_codon:yes stop_codon:yes gene_type:complete
MFSCVDINPGQKGVLFETFGDGLDKETIYAEGKHTIAPWDQMIVYDVKTQTLAYRVDGKDWNGVQVGIEMNILYNAIPDEIGFLHDEIGPNYLNKVMKPKIENIALTVIKEYAFDRIMSDKKDEVKDIIEKMMKEELLSYHINIEEIKISDIIISPAIKEAINRHLESEQLMLEQKYVK